ncbi:septum site-determining protein MinC [Ramlibacter henchirensis]|uniref:Probable septum site-determining protein MinC n=1 Tax=Ramlibacter henchirensis TaxID=204072 RepID=A0A4Z0C5N6_9BURK|nr:septum site-determining protein MinC [Ramlibacter henchirensis]TFZ05419.1 septum site-determining protein MinC [Ramlibacter henchirensis]
MTVALAGRAPATFEIKSANLPLVSLLLKSADLRALAGELQARFGDFPDFFEQDPMVIDLGLLPEDAEVNFAVLVQLLRRYHIVPVAARGGSIPQQRAARAAGLAKADPEVVPPPRLVQARQPEEPAQASAAPARPEPVENHAPAAAGALVLDKPLRSGQQVYARGRDLVVMSMVNPGAEVIADGSIHVYAPLRGKAIAGARGNSDARIVTLCLEPELISIAGVYRTSDTALPPEVLGKPTQVRLDGGMEGRLVMEALEFAPSPAGGGSGRQRSPDAARPQPTFSRKGKA